MRGRVLPLLLIALVAVGLTSESCPRWRCAERAADVALATAHEHAAHAHQGSQHADHAAQHARHAGHGAHHAAHADATTAEAPHLARAMAHDCCAHEGLTNPPCCPTIQIGPEQAPPAAGRAADAVQLAAAPPLPLVLAAPSATSHPSPRRFDPGAPPRTLFAQQTSLLI
ncbi:MAG TPA: hypothetical protein VIS07_00575 [Candidatus Binatia bacterium]